MVILNSSSDFQFSVPGFFGIQDSSKASSYDLYQFYLHLPLFLLLSDKILAFIQFFVFF